MNQRITLRLKPQSVLWALMQHAWYWERNHDPNDMLQRAINVKLRRERENRRVDEIMAPITRMLSDLAGRYSCGYVLQEMQQAIAVRDAE